MSRAGGAGPAGTASAHPNPLDFVIRAAESPADFGTIRDLFLEYQRAIGVDLCFQGFRRELDTLPGAYAPPSGRLLLAWGNGLPAGCVAMRPADGASAEMKRLYLRPAFRGGGRSRLLVLALLEAARGAGYRRVVLDTLESMTSARALYRSLGFAPTAPFGEHPVDGTIFLSLDL